jgi:hypothetical protein
MDDFRLDPVSPADSYRDRQPSGSGDRKKYKQPADAAAVEDEVIRVEPGDPQVEGAAQDYYSPSARARPGE